MNGSQLMGLDCMGVEIYDIRGLTIGQRTPRFWGVTAWYQSLGI